MFIRLVDKIIVTYITFVSEKLVISSSEYPISVKISLLCSPNNGGCLSILPGVSENLIGSPVCLTSPRVGWGIVSNISRCNTWGSVNTSTRSLIGPAGTFTPCNIATHSDEERERKCSCNNGTILDRFLTLSPFVEYSWSFCNSGFSIPLQNRSQSLSEPVKGNANHRRGPQRASSFSSRIQAAYVFLYTPSHDLVMPCIWLQRPRSNSA